MDRRKQLDEIFKDIDPNERTLVDNLIDDVVFMEHQMNELKKLPFIRVHPSDPSKQEATKASKQYKDLSQSYMNAIKILCSLLSKEEGGDDTPLREYFKRLSK